MVLGHEGCGAINAALDTVIHGVRHHSRIAKLVKNIAPAFEGLDLSIPQSRLLPRAVEANVRHIMGRIHESPEGKVRIKEGRMKLVGGIYGLKSGRVTLLK